MVAAVLSFAATKLKPLQEKNIEIAKKLDILKSIYKAENIAEETDKHSYVESQYEQYITESYVIDVNGERKEGVDAFGVDLKVELAKEPQERNLPIFVAEENNEKKYIIPVRGKGLWGPIWGYVALRDDYNTIFGTTFDHDAETPGLGAAINTGGFQAQFKGKKIFEDEEFVGIRVVKGGAPPQDEHAVDAISGGTITSKGLEDMLTDVLGNYVAYFNANKN